MSRLARTSTLGTTSPLGGLQETSPEHLGAMPVEQEGEGSAPSGSRYRILGLAGTGGMGVVYRALDTRLGRTVALKFLPPLLAPNPQAKSRLLAEARAASALDHPNICTVYEVGETTAGQLFFAMAFYQGETLKARMESGCLAVADAVQIALQVASGLAHAHRRGVVHRDVKPANLMLTADGLVKILDFGIAKVPEQVRAEAPLLGTPSYMSPEQALGEEAEAPSDVWSLGAVLFEMLAGRPPEGITRTENLAAMGLDLTRLRAQSPVSLEAVLSRMLAARPADRYPDACALLSDLSRLERLECRVQGRASHRGRRLLALVAVPAAVLILFSGRWLPGSGNGKGAVEPAEVPTSFARLTDSAGKEGFPSISPDGRWVVFAKKAGGRSRLFLQRVGHGNPMDLLPDPGQDGTQPALSPDGWRIAFRSERDGGGVFVTAATGKSMRRITDFGFNPAWSPDGRELLCATEAVVNPRIRRHPSEIYRISVATGERRLVSRGDAVQPSWSPHGFRIAYWGISASGQRIISTIPADGGEPVQVTNDASVDWNPIWSPDGRYLYFTSDRSGVMNLWRVEIEERSGRVMGEPQPVTSSSQASLLPSMARDGRHIVYASDDSKTVIEKFELDTDRGTTGSRPLAIASTSQMILTLDASSDGRWLVLHTSVPQESLFVMHPDGTGLRQMTHDGFKNRQPRWSPDGKQIVFYSNRGGTYGIWTLRTEGGDPQPAMLMPGRPAYHPIWSPDGLHIAFYFRENEALIDLSQPLANRRPQLLPLVGDRRSFDASSWSPDGQFLAGTLHLADGAQIPGIYLYSLAEKGYLQVAARGSGPVWLADSRKLLYWDVDRFALLDTQTRKSRTVWKARADSDYNDWCLSPDNRSLYVVRSTEEGDIWMLTLK